MENNNGQMVKHIKGSGLTIWCKVKEIFGGWTVVIIQVYILFKKKVIRWFL